MRLLVNENFPLLSVKLIRQAGYDIASITEDCPGIEDIEVLTRAVNEQRIILTFDRDYGELHLSLKKTIAKRSDLSSVSSPFPRRNSRNMAKPLAN